MSKKVDLKLGEQNEKSLISIISNFIKTDLIKDDNIYSIFDFHNEKNDIFVELKSRRIEHNKYPTALIGLNKVKKCNNTNDYYFIWNYNDGLFYLKYDKEIFDKFQIQDDYKIKYRFDVGRPEISKVVHIPYKYLTKI
jgi:hypothetical protein